MLWRIRNFKGIGSAEIDIRAGKATVSYVRTKQIFTKPDESQLRRG